MPRKQLYIIFGLLILSIFLVWNFIIPQDTARKPIPFEEFDLAGGPERYGRGFPQREIIDLATEFFGVFHRSGPEEQKIIALTFDDGPDDNFTPKILDILKEHKVPATFFVMGRRCELFPEVVSRMANEGHIIGNHTYTHPNIVKLSNKKALKELSDTDKIVKEIAGYTPFLFRSPYGSLDREKTKLIVNSGYNIIAWNVDSLDWRGLSADEVKTNILENVIEGSIILQHSAGGIGEDLSGTVQALDEIIKVLKKDGFEFVTVDKLLGIPFKKETD
ncbi:MAG: polysaccharide deacetylase family protein [Bacillota bacterium]